LYISKRADRKIIQEEWIKQVIDSPMKEEIQTDGRIRRWGKIDEYGGRVLRVILLEDGETVHNAFFDRSFKEKQR
jgi:hypothetical protein